MEDINIVGLLYPAVGTDGYRAAKFAINLEGNRQRYVATRRERPPLTAAPAQVDYSRQEREATQDPEEKHDSLDYEPSLAIDLTQIPSTPLGLVAGWNPKAGIVLPRGPGISFNHFSLTFDDAYRFIVRDLGSRLGTTVIYGDKDEGPRSKNIPWIIGGDETLGGRGPIRIRVTEDLQFRIVVSKYDINSEALRAKVDAFRAGTPSVEDDLDGLVIRPATELPTGTHTPGDGAVLLKKRLGQGGFADVYHVWNASTSEVFALKEPKEELEPGDEAAWENEALLMGRVSHEHIVKFLGYERGPPPSLRFEYLPGGSLWDHLHNRRYFSSFECGQITRQISSALSCIHNLHPSITHRDITDANILIKERGTDMIVVKLADFGISKEGPELKTLIGTPRFLPPEFFEPTGSNSLQTGARYTTAIDIWELGAVVAKLLCGHPKYTDAHKKYRRLWCQDICRRVESYFRRTRDALARFLLDSMLCMKPEARKEARVCHQSSLLLPEGSRDTWKDLTVKAPVPMVYKKVSGRPGEHAEEGGEQVREGDEEDATTIRLQGRNGRGIKPPRIIVDRGTGGVTADPGINYGNSSDPPSPSPFEDLGVTASLRELCTVYKPGASESLSGTASGRQFYRSGAPPPPTLRIDRTAMKDLLEKMADPEGSLYFESDFGDDSDFSDVTESDGGTATPTPRNPNQAPGPAPSTSAVIPAEKDQGRPVTVTKKRKLGVITVPDEHEHAEEAILDLKRFMDEEAARGMGRGNLQVDEQQARSPRPVPIEG